ncbi:MAG: epoxyqueuosine reductase QueH [Planctomycetota bacterium]
MNNKVLLHICCGICAIEPAMSLAKEGFAVNGYFYNPNIHPFMEFQKRLKAVEIAAERLKARPELPEFNMIFDKEYGLLPFLRLVAGKEDVRCPVCYRMRLEKTAELAAENGYAFFSTTLLSSPHQNHGLLREIGDDTARQFNISFLYRDMRGLHEESKKKAKKMSLYNQQYCGCIFSEYDRYARE